MKNPEAITSEKPHYVKVQEKINDHVASGEIVLPLESKITTGQLIRSSNFEMMDWAVSVEREAITLMVIAYIYGKDNKAAIPEYIVDSPDTIPEAELNKTLVGLDKYHEQGLKIIEGEISKKQYIAELDRTAQLFIEVNYPEFAPREKAKR